MGVEMLAELRRMDTPCMVFNDLTKDERWRKRRCVAEGHSGKFAACTLLKTPYNQVIIGAYAVVDDEPRNGLSEEELVFLAEMGETVMEYLEAERIKQKQPRAERMVKALGLFVEGKSSLQDWWLKSGYPQIEVSSSSRKRDTPSLGDHADEEFDVQKPSCRPSRLPMQQTSMVASPECDTKGSQYFPSGTSSTTMTTLESHDDPATAASSVDNESLQGTISEKASDSLPKQLQDALLTTDVKMVFSQASNLIREATSVEGVVFYDASLGSFGGSSRKDSMDDQAPGEFYLNRPSDQTISSSEDDHRRNSVGSSLNGDTTAQGESEKTCNVLGLSTGNRSSLRKYCSTDALRRFPESVMRKMLKRYPHGKVFNFEEDGSFSSSESEGVVSGGYAAQPATPRRSKKRLAREEEAAAILAAAIGARSVVWFPLWDQSKEGWFAGSLAWSTRPTCVLCPVEDLTYMASFGNNVMAEVSRLSALVAAQMKTDFISSISHELRSSLHGVLASVEFLQETEINKMQVDMVNNIQASGKVLLDTINHVLDFSKVNKRTKEKP